MPGGESWISLLWVLICVVLIIGLAYWFTRSVVGSGKLGPLLVGRGTEQFRILAQLPLGKDQHLTLVQAGQRYFLLGTTPAGISMLAEFTREEAEAWLSAENPPDSGPAMSFSEALHTVLRKKK